MSQRKHTKVWPWFIARLGTEMSWMILAPFFFVLLQKPYWIAAIPAAVPTIPIIISVLLTSRALCALYAAVNADKKDQKSKWGDFIVAAGIAIGSIVGTALFLTYSISVPVFSAIALAGAECWYVAKTLFHGFKAISYLIKAREADNPENKAHCKQKAKEHGKACGVSLLTAGVIGLVIAFAVKVPVALAGLSLFIGTLSLVGICQEIKTYKRKQKQKDKNDIRSNLEDPLDPKKDPAPDQKLECNIIQNPSLKTEKSSSPSSSPIKSPSNYYFPFWTNKPGKQRNSLTLNTSSDRSHNSSQNKPTPGNVSNS